MAQHLHLQNGKQMHISFGQQAAVSISVTSYSIHGWVS